MRLGDTKMRNGEMGKRMRAIKGRWAGEDERGDER